MFEAKPRAVEKKESSTETGSVTAKSTDLYKIMFFYIYTHA